MVGSSELGPTQLNVNHQLNVNSATPYYFDSIFLYNNISQRFRTYAQIKERIKVAIAELDNSIYANIRAAADSNHKDTLKAYITRCDALHIPPLIPQLISAAQRILNLEYLDTNTVEVYERYFTTLKRVINKYAIQPRDLYNIDKIGIYIGLLSNINREAITVVETIATNSLVLALFIILKGKVYLLK
ncbi:transposase [Pyrenophora seminiperda CCB06]|uniref:Transposase n=1 Tax=Pyrenophora seminiperda CCB06 TaxID=1302712 RepID=A0A3M7MGD3_9PLEO|nr:transposase [Pyrenophora seminiperda CCB06]